ncbi:MAG: nodulation S family protein [Actinobacteria bacterium]|nr:nodulation S family protein [Actinomycetota bacterium]
MRERLGREYFDELYAQSRDPWDFETSEYERDKYERTLSVLARRQRSYRRALEVGCSIGVFTAMLAPLCGELLAVDVSEKAITVAQQRLADFPNVRVELRTRTRATV